MERQRRKDTRPEMALRSELHRRGLRYRIHRAIVPGSSRLADIVFPTVRLCVDVRGCWWHGCADHFATPAANRDWWTDKIEANRRRDLDTERRLAEAGWRVEVVWEHDDVAAVVDRIERLVRAAREVSLVKTRQAHRPAHDGRDRPPRSRRRPP